VSDSREQSYYEIALTNRQVLSVFVVLLVCVLASFLGGVWVGRSGSPAVATVEPTAIASGRDIGERPLEELDFFERGGEGAAAESAGAPAATEPTSQASAEQPIIIEELGPRRPAAPSGSAGASNRDAPLAGTTASAPAPTPSIEEAAADLVGALESGDVVVQVFSSRDEAQARRVVDRLRAGDYPAALSPVDVDGSPMYRVRVGPYSDRGKAQEVADVIRRTYKLDTWITR